ncbi:hypothetical protein EVAR_43678_1 [Eumeta japonica]|uniref:Uncharacterized protein n=1 Tax=Eumeta variegata TaxID=151549 RepID=A0A4C1WWR6_EUMVA|nr:hypothetical protein EVAR_43678_1 [Eumeta japonica]
MTGPVVRRGRLRAKISAPSSAPSSGVGCAHRARAFEGSEQRAPRPRTNRVEPFMARRQLCLIALPVYFLETAAENSLFGQSCSLCGSVQLAAVVGARGRTCARHDSAFTHTASLNYYEFRIT